MEQVKVGYKKTEVGLIPVDWNLLSVSDVMGFSGGSQPPRYTFKFSPQKDYIRLIQIRDYKTDKYESYIPIELANKTCKDDDIMIGRYGPPIFQILKGIEGAYNVALIKVKPKDNILKSYAYYFLKQQKLYDFVEKLSQRSSGQTGVDLIQLKSYKVPLPPTLTEQKAIATALSDVDELITKLEKLIEKKKAIKQGAMQQLLTPPHKGGKRLDGFSGEWMEKRLGEISKIKTGSKNNQDKVEDGLYPFFVRSQTIERIDTYSYDCEAILVPGEGGIGSIFHYINGKFEVHQRVYKISDFEFEVVGKYIFLQMMFSFGKHAMTNSVKATVDSLRLPTFEEFVVPIPPNIEEQKHISSILTEMDFDIEQLENRKSKYKSIKLGMMQELLTGKTRLI